MSDKLTKIEAQAGCLGLISFVLFFAIGFGLGLVYSQSMIACKGVLFNQIILYFGFTLSTIAVGYVIRQKEVNKRGFNAMPCLIIVTTPIMALVGLLMFFQSNHNYQVISVLEFFSGLCFTLMFMSSEETTAELK